MTSRGLSILWDCFLIEFELGNPVLLGVIRCCLGFATFLDGVARMLLGGVVRHSTGVSRPSRKPMSRTCSSLMRLAGPTRLFDGVTRLLACFASFVDGVAKQLRLARFNCLTSEACVVSPVDLKSSVVLRDSFGARELAWLCEECQPRNLCFCSRDIDVS